MGSCWIETYKIFLKNAYYTFSIVAENHLLQVAGYYLFSTNTHECVMVSECGTKEVYVFGNY